MNLGSDKVVTEYESSGREGMNFEKNNRPIKKLLVECLHNSDGAIKEFRGFEATLFVEVRKCKDKSPLVPFHGITLQYS